MTDSAAPHPPRIPGYEGGPFTAYPELLEEPLFWLSHLGSCARSQQAQRLLFGADYEAAEEFSRALWDKEDWPLFTVALTADHRFHVVYRTIDGDCGIDYLLHHPTWDTAELLAQDDGHFMGPALSWLELATAADSTPPDADTRDAHARLLLLLPAMGDDAPPSTAAPRLAAALRAHTAVEDPEHLALLLLDQQGQPGPAHWRTTEDRVRVNDGRYSYRNPANPFCLPNDRLTRVSAALTV
ncbi:hypothetical protein [Kitasatospora sp. NPDC056531]|uniref:hypothetical protein n=1 Tax=Kitasatospora sp. NPDC056531 TaxID=3345856 RepID=UPI0036C97A66